MPRSADNEELLTACRRMVKQALSLPRGASNKEIERGLVRGARSLLRSLSAEEKQLVKIGETPARLTEA